MEKHILCVFLFLSLLSCKNPLEEEGAAREPTYQRTHEIQSHQGLVKHDSIPIIPIEHASFVMQLNKKTIYVDPMEDARLYKDYLAPDLVLITFDDPGKSISQALRELIKKTTVLVAPESVNLTFPNALNKQTVVLKKKQDTLLNGIRVKALAKANFNSRQTDLLSSESANSYVVKANKKLVYIPGKNWDILELGTLKDIDLVFIRMDIPNTTALKKVIDAVVELKPQKVYPYAYEGIQAYSDVALFKRGVERKTSEIDVEVLNWYPDKE